ncbi:MAG: hypothetical protein Q4F39_02595 [Bacteroidia bacterium]|nr:hypothetical protein [Bacteroidia bacterium]
MKKLTLFAAAALMLLSVSSCSVLSAISGQQSQSLTNGLKVGSALLNLYNQYQGAGKIDMTTLNNINNVANVVNGIKNIKQLTGADTSLSDFAQGLMNGSSNLINQNNAAGIISGLTSLSQTDLSGTSNAASILATQALSKLSQNQFMSNVFSNVSNDGDNLTTAVSGLTGLLNLIK